MTVSPIRWEGSPSLQLYCPEYQGGGAGKSHLSYPAKLYDTPLKSCIAKLCAIRLFCAKEVGAAATMSENHTYHFSLCQDSNQVRGCIRISKSARVLVHLQAIKLVCRYGRLEGDFVVTQNQNTSNENVVNDVGEFQRCQRCGRVAPDCRWQRK